jgi:hypothetical protein
MFCSNNRTICSGCLHENLRHRKVERLENELLEDTTANEILAPILDYIQKPITLKTFRESMKHLPTMNIHKQDDHIFGAARYLANSIGSIISDITSNESIDPLITSSECNEIWRQAKFHCKCNPSERFQQDIGKRAFCVKCSFLIFHTKPDPTDETCPGCFTNPSWCNTTHPCIACQLTTIVYRGPFQQRFKKQLEYWLNSDDTDDTDGANDIVSPQPSQLNSTVTPTINKQDMLSRRTRTIEKSYESIKSRGSAEQRRFVFENLSILQNDCPSGRSIKYSTFLL